MTDRKQALTDLLAKVEVGSEPGFDDMIVLLVFTAASDQEKVKAAFNGSLDAALALHKRVMPEQSIRIERRVGGWVVWLDNPHHGISDTPARAWLIAILRALIAQEEERE